MLESAANWSLSTIPTASIHISIERHSYVPENQEHRIGASNACLSEQRTITLLLEVNDISN